MGEDMEVTFLYRGGMCMTCVESEGVCSCSKCQAHSICALSVIKHTVVCALIATSGIS